ncbi:CRISPR associated protein of unknown function [Dickeya aquatica]|uniref:Uncharacterized protein n=1 Tax=Dickeya aquatica TaxID=1401087 RepID=A0A375A646_9GAMM|nr:CRISPR associated protein of unknown function [Dickeya aquatica]
MTGLSPLARGTHTAPPLTLAYHRFIPAGAGNTVQSAEIASSQPVYPRWRGEHIGAALDAKSYTGLSPLARGTLRSQTTGKAAPRFIPAGAGNTVDVFSSDEAETVYPRWRGEHPKRKS